MGEGGTGSGPNRPDCIPILSRRSDRPRLTVAPALLYSLPRIKRAEEGRREGGGEIGSEVREESKRERNRREEGVKKEDNRNGRRG